MGVRFIISRGSLYDYIDKALSSCECVGVLCDIRSDGKNPMHIAMMHTSHRIGADHEFRQFLDGYRYDADRACVVFVNNVAFWPGSIGAYYAKHHLHAGRSDGHDLAGIAYSCYKCGGIWRDYHYRAAYVAFEEFAKRGVKYIWIEGYDKNRGWDSLLHAVKDVGLRYGCSFELECFGFGNNNFSIPDIRELLPTEEDMLVCEYRPFDHPRRELPQSKRDRQSLSSLAMDGIRPVDYRLTEIEFSKGLTAIE